SQSANDVIATFAPTLTNGGTYVAAVQGVAGGSPALSLVVNSAARERALDQDRVEVAVLHGIVDAPAVDVSNWFTDGLFVSDLAYGEFTDYLSLPPAFWALRASESGNLAKTAGIWAGDFSAGAGLAAVLFATGRIGDDTHDLWVLLPDGSTLPMLAAAEAQMIHDAIGTDVVDVYYDQDVAIQDFEFRTATNYGLFPARSAFALGIAPGNSQSAADITFSKALNLRLGKTYTFIPAGEAGTPQFDVFVNENARFAAFNPANAEFNLFHGSPNAPEVDVARLGGSPVLFDNVQFGEYTDYMSVPPADYPISVTPADNNSLVVQSYRADVSGLAGQAFTVFASGLLGGTPAFELWAALADGLTFALPVLVNTDELDQRLSDLSISPNPAVYEVMLRFSLTEPEALRYALRDLTGRLVMEGDLGLVPAGDFAQRLDVSQLVAGMYTLELRSDTGLRSLKVVVAD
ncbi:MAG TPA: DUF4397 domain-containing protein, partial [Saprospiraceae bacterium]|nr:DUF4397 domain-containing protein [Saprospiraceae bacterium]